MFLSKKLSNCITSSLLQNNFIKQEETEIYEYCFDYFFEQFFYTAAVLCLGIILHCFDTTLIFLCMFFFFRQCGGGIHAPTERLCSVISNLMYAFVLIAIPRFSFQNSILWAVLFAISIICIAALAPVENENKHFAEKKRKQLRHICIMGSVFFSIIFMMFYIMQMRPYYGTMSLCSFVAASGMLLGSLSQKGRAGNVA